jgi:hypothetical protein
VIRTGTPKYENRTDITSVAFVDGRGNFNPWNYLCGVDGF